MSVEPSLAALLDGMPGGIALLDAEWRHRYANAEYARLLGQPVAAVLGRTIADLLGDIAFAALRAHGDRAMAGETVTWEGWMPLTQAAELRFLQLRLVPRREPAGAVAGLLVHVRDLTEQKISERQLAAQVTALSMSQALNAAITASALDCVIVIDAGGCVVEFNPAAERTFGHRRADVLGKPIGEIIVPPAMRAAHASGFARYLASGEAHVLGRRIEIEGMRASGEIFPLELAITEVRLGEQRLFTAYLRDLTTARAAAAEIRQSQEALLQSEKMAALGSLLAGVAHELNNPLSIVIGNAMILTEDAAETGSPLAGRAEKIQQAAERCARIVRTFLSMARQRQIALRAVAVAPLVREAVELLGYSLRTGGVVVDVRLPDDLPDVVGDPDRLNQVLVNLIVNAQQAMAAQPAPRRLAIEGSVAQGQVVLAVADNGPGVPPDIRRRIFDPFFTTKPMGAGTGIGLAVSRGIVEAHGGTLTLAAPLAGGARFEMRLKLASAEDAPASTPGPTAPAPVPAPRRHSALIVDDEPEVAAVLAHMAGSLGYACDIAEGGAAGCRHLAARDYDVILCDLHMPEVDGAAVFGWLAANKPDLCARVAFITGDTLGQAASGFLARAARPVLEKPFVPDEVRKILALLPPGMATA